MAIVEDGDINESEEENKIELVGFVVEEEDSWDEESVEGSNAAELYERKAEDLEMQIEANPFNYNLHIELLNVLLNVPDFDRWRNAFIKLQALGPIKENLWELRLNTEIKQAATSTNFKDLAALFIESCHDCYSPLILSDWANWAVTLVNAEDVRAQISHILRKGGLDPFDGQTLWVAAVDFETKVLGNMSENDPNYKNQAERVLFYLEEMVSRPLLNAERGWPEFELLANKLHGPEYVAKVKKQHERAQEFLQQLIEFEEKIQTTSDVNEKCNIYLQYIEKVKELAKDKERYRDCDTNGIIRVLYDRATSECGESEFSRGMYTEWTRWGGEGFTPGGTGGTGGSGGQSWLMCGRGAARRRPQQACGWVASIRASETVGRDFEEIKTLLESALGSNLESFKDTQQVWFAYLEYILRCTDVQDEASTDRLRKTFRLAWDSLAEWGDAANESDIPLFWAKIEYELLDSPKEGKEIFEELFTYGRNKTLSKYWEALVHLEQGRRPRPSPNKLRDLLRRAVTHVADYPYTVAHMWATHERLYGSLHHYLDADTYCREKIKQWEAERDAKKKVQTGFKQNNSILKNMLGKASEALNKGKGKGKRKADGKPVEGGKRQKMGEINGEKSGVVVEKKDEKVAENGSSLKRSHEKEKESGESSSKRLRTEGGPNTEACTLFVSNLPFSVDEEKLREKLSEFGKIVSLRLKCGVKAFGGSICYCQYENAESVEAAVKQDRSPFLGRPMYLSRYSSRSGPGRVRAGVPENHKLFLRDLPRSVTQEQLRDIFGKYGELKDIRIVTYKDGTPKGLAYIEYESEQSAGAALQAHGTLLGGHRIQVAISAPPPHRGPGPHTPHTPHTPAPGHTQHYTTTRRRTQLSSFIPSVLQRPSTSATSTPNATQDTPKITPQDPPKNTPQETQNEPTNKPMTNNDFRAMLLNK